MMRGMIIAATLVPLIGSADAGAQVPPDLNIDRSRPYHHELSGLVLPTVLDGFRLAKAAAFAPEHLDEDFNYFNGTTDDDITVFVFRNVSGSVPVWFDRIASAVERRDIYGGPTPIMPPTAFAPPGQSAASGLMATWRPGKSRFRSTGLAFMPLGPNWYVEVRYSSPAIEPEAMETHLRNVVRSLGWPKKPVARVAATPVTDCSTPLQLSGRASTLPSGKDAPANILFGALNAGFAANATKKSKTSSEPERGWCRDTGAYGLPTQYGVYRPVETTDRYLITFNDAGRGIWVGPNTLAGLIAAEHGTSTSSWSVSLLDVATTTNFVDRDRLPPPDQAFTITRTESYASRSSTWGKKRNIQINSDLMK